MKNKARLLMLAGLVALLIGGVLRFTGGPPAADAALVARCQRTMAARNAEASLLAQCKDAAFATAVTATDAASAAQAIGAANRQEIGSHSLSMFLMGLGAVLLVTGFLQERKRKGTSA